MTLKAIRAGVGWVWLARLFNYKHKRWLYRSPCVTPCVSDNGSHRRVNTAATLQAVYLVWLFLRITTACNLSIIGLVRKGFPESLAHACTRLGRPRGVIFFRRGRWQLLIMFVIRQRWQLWKIQECFDKMTVLV